MGDKIKVLMVDDEEQFRSTTGKIVQRKGFEIVLAASGEEAINKLDEQPDVVILDVKMPGMDGHQALEEIKKHSPDLPVIMLTGHGALPSAKQALQKGAFDYLAKPCDINILTGKIEDASRHSKDPKAFEEKRVMGVMVPLEEYTTVSGEESVKDAIIKLKASFASKIGLWKPAIVRFWS